MKMDVMTAIRDRRSVRRYKSDPVPLKDINLVIEAGRWAPTGGNRQYWKYIIINDLKTMKMVKNVSPMFWGESPAGIIVCLDVDRSTISTEKGAVSGDCAGFPAQNMLLAAHALGLGACPIAGFNKKALKMILDIPDEIEPILLISLGYPDEAPLPKPRRPISEIVYLNSCKTPWRDTNE